MRANTTPRPDARTAYATPQTDGKRIAWVDCAKALAIIGVMLVHTATPDAAKHAIYVALIPLFFYLAGLFADVHKDLTPEVYLQRQWRRLLLPYFSFGLLHYVLWWTVGRHFGADAGTTVAAWKPLWGIVWGNADSLTQYVPLWFLPCLFSTETLYYIGVRPALTRRARLLRMAALALLGASLSTLEVELPGVDKKDIDIDLHDGYLNIAVNKSDKTEEGKKENYIHRERSFSCSRSYYVGDVDRDAIKAKYDNGILSVTLPKDQPKKPSSRIDIE